MRRLGLFLVLANLFTSFTANAADEVTIYSVYDGARLDAIFKPFTERTGIKVNIVTGTSVELAARLKAEGETSPADLYLDKDLVYQGSATASDLYLPFKSKVVEKNIPSHLIDAGKNWFTIFYRARVIMYNTNKVSADELSTYADLTDSKWKGRLCLRTSTNSYSEALNAYLVTHYGQAKALEIMKGWVNNFSVDPIKGDTDAINAVAAGTCDVTIANTYYLAPMIKNDASFPVRPFFPNQETFGAHINGVGIGIAKHSKNVKEATMVLEYMSSVEVQTPVAAAFSQYPANPEASMTSVLTGFGKFKQDTTNVGEISKSVNAGRALAKEAQYK